MEFRLLIWDVCNWYCVSSIMVCLLLYLYGICECKKCERKRH